jgi:hypothetical protein
MFEQKLKLQNPD